MVSVCLLSNIQNVLGRWWHAVGDSIELRGVIQLHRPSLSHILDQSSLTTTVLVVIKR